MGVMSTVTRKERGCESEGWPLTVNIKVCAGDHSCILAGVGWLHNTLVHPTVPPLYI